MSLSKSCLPAGIFYPSFFEGALPSMDARVFIIDNYEITQAPGGRLISFNADAGALLAIDALGEAPELARHGDDILVSSAEGLSCLSFPDAFHLIESGAEAESPIYLFWFDEARDAPPAAKLLRWDCHAPLG